MELHEVDADKLFNDLKAGKTATLSDYYKDEGVREGIDLAIDKAHDTFLNQLNTFKEKPTRKMLEDALADREKWIDGLAALLKSGKTDGIFNGKYVKNVDVLKSMASMLGQRKVLQELLDKDFKEGTAAQGDELTDNDILDAVVNGDLSNIDKLSYIDSDAGGRLKNLFDEGYNTAKESFESKKSSNELSDADVEKEITDSNLKIVKTSLA